jgi:hypothetical protein
MAKINQPRPTDAELEICACSGGGRFHRSRRLDALSKTKPIGYTTVLKFMQIMAEKVWCGAMKKQRACV